MRPLRIGIDARWIFPSMSGIGRYTERLIRHLALLDAEDHFVLFFRREAIRRDLWGRFGLDARGHFRPCLLPCGPFSPRSQLLIPRAVRARRLDLFHSTNFMIPLTLKRCAVVATVHDLIPLKHPEFAPRSKKSRLHPLYRLLMRRIARRADALLADSDHSRRDILECLDVAPAKVHAVPVGVDEEYRPGERPAVRRALRNRYGISPPFLLYVGRYDPYKNVPLLVETLAGLLGRGHGPLQLVLVGARDRRYPEAEERARSLGVERFTIFAEGVSDLDLVELYRMARLLVLPSLYEGFGLPVVEAMACGTPVVCSDRASLPEVAADGALLADPEKGEELLLAVERALTDEGLRAELRKRGLKRAAMFSWEETARRTLEIYREAAIKAGVME